MLAAVFVSIAVAVCFLTDPKTDAEQPEEEPPASSTADSPAEADSTPPTSAFFSSIEDYAEYYIAQVILPEPIEYKVLTDGGFETVTDTVQDAQMVNLEQLASLSDLDPEGDLQLWSYKIAIAPENADGRTFLLGRRYRPFIHRWAGIPAGQHPLSRDRHLSQPDAGLPPARLDKGHGRHGAGRV